MTSHGTHSNDEPCRQVDEDGDGGVTDRHVVDDTRYDRER